MKVILKKNIFFYLHPTAFYCSILDIERCNAILMHIYEILVLVESKIYLFIIYIYIKKMSFFSNKFK